MVTVLFEPEGRRVTVEPGTTILEAARGAGVGVRSECGGEGSCGTCRVIVEDQSGLGRVSEDERRHLKPSEVRRGYRLSCRASIRGDAVVFIPPETRVGLRRVQTEGLERPVKLEPLVRKFHLRLPRPSLRDLRPDLERLLDSLWDAASVRPVVDLELLRGLPEALRRADWDVTVAVWDGRRVVSVEEGDTVGALYGFSVDIGTSKIVGYLVDLNSGAVASVESRENPQVAHGEDVLSRVSYAVGARGGLRRLQRLVVEAVNGLVSDSCEEAGVDPRRVYEVTVVGNTAMHHLFLGIPPRHLALAPYVPAVKAPLDIEARSLGLQVNPRGNVHVLPVIAGFVGADAVADILATGLHESDETRLLMDVGTNGEVFVGNRGDIVSCSCAAGPAFEGMHIRHGMKAVTGAIERLRIDPETHEVKYETIGGGRPVGLCGSGVLDAVAEMFRCGILNRQGGFTGDARSPRLRRIDGERETEFVVAWREETGTGQEITVSRQDIQEAQLAKAAMHTGAALLMEEKGLTEADLDRVYVAGAFGGYLNPESARLIGLIPDVPPEKIRFVGNTAISGAKMALVSREAREEAKRLARRVRYVELMTVPGFSREFASSMFLPHRDLGRYPTVAEYLRSREVRPGDTGPLTPPDAHRKPTDKSGLTITRTGRQIPKTRVREPD